MGTIQSLLWEQLQNDLKDNVEQLRHLEGFDAWAFLPSKVPMKTHNYAIFWSKSPGTPTYTISPEGLFNSDDENVITFQYGEAKKSKNKNKRQWRKDLLLVKNGDTVLGITKKRDSRGCKLKSEIDNWAVDNMNHPFQIEHWAYYRLLNDYKIMAHVYYSKQQKASANNSLLVYINQNCALEDVELILSLIAVENPLDDCTCENGFSLSEFIAVSSGVSYEGIKNRSPFCCNFNKPDDAHLPVTPEEEEDNSQSLIDEFVDVDSPKGTSQSDEVVTEETKEAVVEVNVDLKGTESNGEQVEKLKQEEDDAIGGVKSEDKIKEAVVEVNVDLKGTGSNGEHVEKLKQEEDHTIGGVKTEDKESIVIEVTDTNSPNPTLAENKQ